MADATKKENTLFSKIKSVPTKVGTDIKNTSKTTKVVVGAGTTIVAVGSFFLGRATKKAPKAKVTPTTAK